MFSLVCKRLSVVLLFLLISCSQEQPGKPKQPNPQLPKNIIFMIGDGMGFEQLKAASLYAHGQESQLFMQSLPVQGEVSTRAANTAITDSAAAGTAMATGFKVNYQVVSRALPANDQYTENQPMTTLLEYYREKGKSVGLVTTTHLTHATPATFAAHVKVRNEYEEIGKQYLQPKNRPDVMLGGGGQGLDAEAVRQAGYQVVTDRDALLKINTDKTTHLCGLFGETHMHYETDGVGDQPHLSDMTKKALDLLDNNPKGFFVMIESGRIDHSGHINHLEKNIHETLEFDKTIRAVLEWAKNRTDTLVIVTADHETGGLKVLNSQGQGQLPKVKWSTKGHTGVNVPLYVWGVNAYRFKGTIDNTDFFKLITELAKNYKRPVVSSDTTTKQSTGQGQP